MTARPRGSGRHAQTARRGTDAAEIARAFEAHRDRLHTVASRILGSTSDADDAVQETWLRLHRNGIAGIDNLGGWLTTVTSRICLNLLRARASRNEDSYEDELEHSPEPAISWTAGPEDAVLTADAVSSALAVILNELSPAQRIAFVLHDIFAIPFDEIAPVVGRTSEATRQLASRARRRVRGAPPAPIAHLEDHQRLVTAFFAAADEGDVAGLLGLLDPDVVLYADFGGDGGRMTLRGPDAVARNARTYATMERVVLPAVVNGAAGVVIHHRGELYGVMSFQVADDRIVEIEAFADPAQMARVAAALSEDGDR